MKTFSDTIIVGGGLSGLVTAFRLKRLQPDHQVTVFEQNERAGGVIRSFAEHGYLAEWGPHGFLDNCAESRELLNDTGLQNESLKASLATYVRYVCINGRLMMIPQSPLKIIRAPLIPFTDKLRVLGDLFTPPLDGEPTVAKWAAHRFGRALLPYVDAVFTGTYAGDYNELKIDAVMPGIRALERQYGSVIRGAIAKARSARKATPMGRKKLAMPSMTSFPNGMQRLPDRLSELLSSDDHLRCGERVLALEQNEQGWTVRTEGGEQRATNVVLALPINQSLRLLTGISSDMGDYSVPEARMATVVFGFKNATLPPGFGFLNPEIEQRFTLGTLFSSNMFPNRAPQGHIVIETLVGGRRHPERLELDDQELSDRALTDIRELLNLPNAPSYTTVLRPDGGIPQLEASYLELLRRRNMLLSARQGLYICGFGWEGIGINDMIKTSCAVAQKICDGIPQVQEQPEVKKVYF